MKKAIYLIAIVSVLFASCAKPNDNPNPNEEKTYSFEIGAEKEMGNTDETRVEMVDGLMHWSVGDQVTMFMHRTGTSTTLIGGLQGLSMTGLHNQPARATTFKTKLTQTEISKLDPSYMYDYYTVYTGGISGGAGVTLVYSSGNSSSNSSVYCRMSSYTVARKNEFVKENVLMMAAVRNRPTATYLENGQQKFNETISFTYKHAYAYLRLKINQNSKGKPVKRVVVRTQYQSGTNEVQTALSGYFNLYYYHNNNILNISPSTLITNGISPELSVDCSANGGVNAGDYIYIPIRPMTFYSSATYGLRFTFTLDDNSSGGTKTVNLTTNGNKSFQAGKIYDIAFNL